jgi:pyruvate dehydrogenase E2 component (dihydrolipoyllysine-residue acetyltransferase)
MAIEVIVPRLGWSMDEGTFGEWLKRDGEFVEAGDAIFVLESEKALQEVESVDSGRLNILPGGPQDGDTVTVGALIGWLLDEGEDVPATPGTESAKNQSATNTVLPAAAEAIHGTVQPKFSEHQPVPAETCGRVSPISPRAARVANELGIDWSGLTGSGRGGRIRECDIRAAATSSLPTESAATTTMSTTRRVIAEKMLNSAQNTAPVTLTTRVDASQLVSLRQQYKSAGHQPAPAFQVIIAKLVAVTLKQHPAMNSQWMDDGLIQPQGVHIGLAVNTDAGLLVPVIRDCDQISLAEVSRQSVRLIERAKQGKCTSNELSGGTFTITNLGAYGIDAFTPIINTPQTGVLGLGAIRRDAVVLDGDRIVPRDQLTISLTFDHRAIDGAPAATFLQDLRGRIENPGPHLIE